MSCVKPALEGQDKVQGALRAAGRSRGGGSRLQDEEGEREVAGARDTSLAGHRGTGGG